MNYKKILLSYIDAVGMNEGVTFTRDARGLTEEEYNELLRCDELSHSLSYPRNDEAAYKEKLKELCAL